MLGPESDADPSLLEYAESFDSYELGESNPPELTEYADSLSEEASAIPGIP